MRRLLVLCLLLGALPARAHEAVPGDLLVVEAGGLCARPELVAFGARWPVRRAGRCRWRGLVGVDLQTKPGDHPLVWLWRGGVRRETVHVRARRFRVSRIEVPERLTRFDRATLARIRREARRIRGCWRKARAGWPAAGRVRPPVAGVVSTPFGARRIVNGAPRSPHAGVDIAAPAGTPVAAPMPGTVALVLEGGYLVGNTVCVAHGGGMASVFMHLARVSVREGQRVAQGEPIGAVGATGRATGPHLHWGVYFRGARLDPLRLPGAGVLAEAGPGG